MSKKQEQTKEQLNAKFNELVKTELAEGRIAEKSTNSGFHCYLCVFGTICLNNIASPCMAHNRPDKQSIYYIRNF